MLASQRVRNGARTVAERWPAAATMREMAFATSGWAVSASAGLAGSQGASSAGKSSGAAVLGLGLGLRREDNGRWLRLLENLELDRALVGVGGRVQDVGTRGQVLLDGELDAGDRAAVFGLLDGEALALDAM